MKSDDFLNSENESVSEMFDSAISKQKWEVEYMQISLQYIEEAKKKVRLLMDHYQEGKMKEDVPSESLWLKMDETDCKLMESMISISEAIGIILSEGLVGKYNQR